MREPITFACCTTPNLNKLKVLLPKVLPWVDKAVLVLGEDNQSVVDYLNELNTDNKIVAVRRTWTDSFSDQYNTYLKFIKEGWIVLCDDDEVPSEGMMASLRPLVDNSNGGEKYSVVEFKVNPISEGQDMGPANYYRQMFFKWTPRLQYRCNLHQYLVGYYNNKVIRSEQIYYHIKSLKDEYRAAARNWWIGGIWLPGPREDGEKRQEWHEMKSIAIKHHPDIKVFNDLARKLEDKTIHPNFIKWICYYNKKFETSSEHNELRAFHGYYYKRLHPDLIPLEMDITKPLLEQLDGTDT